MLRVYAIFTTFLLVLLFMLISWLIVDYETTESIRKKLGLEVNEQPCCYNQMHSLLIRRSQEAGNNRVVFLGDSHVQRMSVSTISFGAVNLGIAGDTTTGLLKRISDYAGIATAKTIVLLIGTNDYKHRENRSILENYEKIISALPHSAKVLIVAIPPVDENIVDDRRNNAAIKRLNELIQNICIDRCQIIQTHDSLANAQGNLKTEYHTGYGIHLNPYGYTILNKLIRNALRR